MDSFGFEKGRNFSKNHLDLKMETIKKGSPHTLRITKTQSSYQRPMQMWNEDVELLEKVKGGMGR